MATHAARHPLRKCADEDEKPWLIDRVETEKLRQNDPLPLILSTPTPLILNTPNIFINIPQWEIFDISGVRGVRLGGEDCTKLRIMSILLLLYLNRTLPFPLHLQNKSERDELVHFGSHSL